MKKISVILGVMICCIVSNAAASILVFSPNGSYTVKATLADANTAADVAGKTVVVTSPLSAVMSNISSSSVHGWRTDAKLKVVKGGSINPTTRFKGLPYAEPEWFGAVGGGVVDDTIALTNFIISINNTGAQGVFQNAIYAISAQLPDINQSGVSLIGKGFGLHDVSPNPTGTVIKWISALGGTMQQITAIPGASNQHLTNVKISGITYNANSKADYGLKILSVFSSDFDFAVHNAATVGAYFGVVATLGEAADTQNNKIRYVGRQIESPNAPSLVLDGSATANTSQNELWVTIQHNANAAIQLLNTDNNSFYSVVCYCVGASYESVSVYGGASSTQRARSDRFYYLSATKPLHAYGTGGAIPFAFASINTQIFALDKENGTPDPSVEVGASVFWRNDRTPLPNTPSTNFASVLTSGTGTLTDATATMRYFLRGTQCFVHATVVITTNGTGASYLKLTLPFANFATFEGVFVGKEMTTGKTLNGSINVGTSELIVQNYDASYQVETAKL